MKTVLSSSSSSSRDKYYLGLLLQDHCTVSTKSVCSSQYMVTDQHWATGAQIKHSTLSDHIREWQPEQNGLQFSALTGLSYQPLLPWSPQRTRTPTPTWGLTGLTGLRICPNSFRYFLAFFYRSHQKHFHFHKVCHTLQLWWYIFVLSHLSTNRARRRLTSLTETNALSLS